ncbi:MAG: hypothetical protein AAF849_04010 [Bacteroidota bacterium]
MLLQSAKDKKNDFKLVDLFIAPEADKFVDSLIRHITNELDLNKSTISTDKKLSHFQKSIPTAV